MPRQSWRVSSAGRLDFIGVTFRMALFRTLSAPEPLPPITGDGVVLRAPQMSDSCGLGRGSREQPQVSDAVGADLAGRRSHAAGVPPAIAALCRGRADRSGLSVLPVPDRGQRPGRRARACQHSPRRRAGRQPRLLGRRAVYPPRLHDGGGAGARFRWRSTCCGCTVSRRPASRPISPRSVSWKRPASGARAMPGPISASTASGRTICFTRKLQSDPRD